MNLTDSKYNRYSIVKEMLETASMIEKLDVKKIEAYAGKIKTKKIFFTGEGSSRIFPAKNTMYKAKIHNYKEYFSTENSTQALEYDLKDSTVFIASNSGRTKEAGRLLRKLKKEGHKAIFGVVANAGTPILEEADFGYLLSCGKEEAVAATKSVLEQALFYDLIFRKTNNLKLPDMKKLGTQVKEVLEMKIPEEITGQLAAAGMIYFAGRNDGVTEEITLKTNEITRKKSDFLEGTYALHGIEEVMDKKDAMVVINPFKEEEDKFCELIEKGVGCKTCAIATRDTCFKTVKIPNAGDFTTYLELAAGWNILIDVGIKLGINMDKTVRARKIGNVI